MLAPICTATISFALRGRRSMPGVHSPNRPGCIRRWFNRRKIAAQQPAGRTSLIVESLSVCRLGHQGKECRGPVPTPTHRRPDRSGNAKAAEQLVLVTGRVAVFRYRSIADCACAALLLAATALGQEIKVVKKPAPAGLDAAAATYSWSVSFSRVNGPTTFELDMANVTEAQAYAEAEALRAWNRGMGASDWSLHTILLEAEPYFETPTMDDDTVARIKRLYDEMAELKEKLHIARYIAQGKAEERALGDTVKEYAGQIQSVYERVTQFKQWLIGRTNLINTKTLDRINRLIDRYNELTIDYNATAPRSDKKIFPVIPLVVSTELSGKIVDTPSRPETAFPKPVPSIDGKPFSGTMGGLKVLAKFQTDGSLVLCDLADRTSELGRGVWAQHRQRLQMTTDNFVYVGTITDDGLDGRRYPKTGGPGSADGPDDAWTLRPDTPPVAQPVVQPPPPVRFSVWGKQYVGPRNLIGKFATLDEARGAMKSDAAKRTATQFKVWIEDENGKQVDAITVGYPPGYRREGRPPRQTV